MIKNKTFSSRYTMTPFAAIPSVPQQTLRVGFELRIWRRANYTVRVEGEGYFGAPANGEFPAAVTQKITISPSRPCRNYPSA
jgi:hypothetical protein